MAQDLAPHFVGSPLVVSLDTVSDPDVVSVSVVNGMRPPPSYQDCVSNEVLFPAGAVAQMMSGLTFSTQTGLMHRLPASQGTRTAIESACRRCSTQAPACSTDSDNDDTNVFTTLAAEKIESILSRKSPHNRFDEFRERVFESVDTSSPDSLIGHLRTIRRFLVAMDHEKERLVAVVRDDHDFDFSRPLRKDMPEDKLRDRLLVRDRYNEYCEVYNRIAEMKSWFELAIREKEAERIIKFLGLTLTMKLPTPLCSPPTRKDTGDDDDEKTGHPSVDS